MSTVLKLRMRLQKLNSQASYSYSPEGDGHCGWEHSVGRFAGYRVVRSVVWLEVVDFGADFVADCSVGVVVSGSENERGGAQLSGWGKGVGGCSGGPGAGF